MNGIPKSPLSYVHVIREDPVRRGLLYAGTENGVYVSFSDGESWQPLQNNLPHAPVYWITVQERFSDLVIATYGRGFWILDDISPLRSLGADVTAKAVHLFAPRDAFRFRNAEASFADIDDFVQGTNPPYGASLHFWLRAASKDSVTLTFTDAAGKVVRTQRASGKAGMNRVWWDLRTDRTREPLLRAANPYSPEVRYAAEGKAAPGVARYSTLVLPGTYTVTLSAAGEKQSQPIAVHRDPSSGATDADIVAQAAMAAQLETDINAAVDMINGLEVVRAQLATVKATLAPDSALLAVRMQADSLEARLRTVEEQLFQTHTTGRGQDLVRLPFRIAEKLVYLGQSIGSSDYAPTDAQKEVQTLLHDALVKAKVQYDAVLTGDLNAFRQLLRSRNLNTNIIF